MFDYRNQSNNNPTDWVLLSSIDLNLARFPSIDYAGKLALLSESKSKLIKSAGEHANGTH